jgi:hypothetical protein
MDLTAWIDVAIGLIVVYLSASLFVTVINEYIAQMLKLRGRDLYRSLKALIVDDKIKAILRTSPAMKPFFDSDPWKAPSYVDPKVFAHLLVGGLAADSSPDKVIAKVNDTLNSLPESDLKSQLMALVRSAGDNTQDLVNAAADWVDRSLSVLGENYKRRLQKISFGIGLIVAVAFNIDTIVLTQHLYQNKDARDAAVALGVQIAEKTDKALIDRCMSSPPQDRAKDTACAPLNGLVDAVQRRNESMSKLPIGWSASPTKTNPPIPISPETWLWMTRAVGWLMTALALSLGAPFWFDLLSKFVAVRHGMRKPETDPAPEAK